MWIIFRRLGSLPTLWRSSGLSWRQQSLLPVHRSHPPHAPLTSSAPGATVKPSVRSLLREYGPISFGVYMSLSFTIFCCCYASIALLGIDAQSLKGLLSTVKSHIPGLSSTDPKESNSTPTLPQENSGNNKDDTIWMNLGANLVLAIAMTKLFVPLKVGLTAYLTPKVAKKLRSLGFNLRKPGGLREARDQIQQSVTNTRDNWKRN